MKIITLKNIIPVIGVSYTLIVLYILMTEIIAGDATKTHLNLLLGLVYTVLSIVILSIHHLLERFSPVVMMIIQYLIAIVLVVSITFGIGLFTKLHPDAYIDSIRSFSMFYLIGMIVYYINLRIQIRKQNKALEFIQQVR